MLDIFDLYTIPLRGWIDTIVFWLQTNARDFFQAIAWPARQLFEGLDSGMRSAPELVMLAIIFLVAWQISRLSIAIGSVIALTFVGFLGFWPETMTTLAMIITAVIICVALGVPLGILAARSDKFEGIQRPILDAMQTTPPFVYLIPVVMLFSIGTVPGVIATIIFAVPPIIRLTNLGIRQVDHEVIEAAFAFGSTQGQVLREVQIPLAMRTIMAGMNQTLMLALSMVVIAALIGAGGLGDPVRRALNNVEPGLGFVAGLGIVVLAISLDRVTQSLGQLRTDSTRPLDLAKRLFSRKRVPSGKGGSVPAGERVGSSNRS